MAQCIDNYWPTSKSLPCGIIKAVCFDCSGSEEADCECAAEPSNPTTIIAVARLAEDHYKKLASLATHNFFSNQ